MRERSAGEAMNRSTVDWLLEGDPSIRWQVLRDLERVPARRWQAEQRRVSREGWGARLLERQRPNGQWGQGFYRPKWTCTTYTLQLLWQLGLPAGHEGVLRACRMILDQAMDPSGEINFWRPLKTGDTCVTAMVLGQLCAFGLEDPRADHLAEHLLGQQMEDGGWNCYRRRSGAVHSSFHTTLSVLEALREYRAADRPRARAARAAEQRGREFLLQHRLYRSSTDGHVVSGEMTRFHFPTHWHFDVMRALDYFQACGAPFDSRLEDAVDLLRVRRRVSGRWSLAAPYPGALHFKMETPGEPSRWNTLRALRVLRWWSRAAGRPMVG